MRKLFGLGTSSHERKVGKEDESKQIVQDALDVTETEVSGDASYFMKSRGILAVK